MCILKLKLEHREYFPWKFDLLAFFGGVGGNDGWESFLREFTKLFIVGVSLIRFFTIGKYFSPERDGGGVGVLAFFRIYWLMWTKLCVFRKSCHFFLRWISTLFLYFFFDFFSFFTEKEKIMNQRVGTWKPSRFIGVNVLCEDSYFPMLRSLLICFFPKAWLRESHLSDAVSLPLST